MDHLSGAASVIEVMQLARAVADFYGDYLKVKTAQKDINDLIREIKSLESILESVKGVRQGPDGKSLIALQKMSDDDGNFKMTLESLGDKINPETTQNEIRMHGSRYWKWPLQGQETDDVISQLEGYISVLVAALQVDHLWVAA